MSNLLQTTNSNYLKYFYDESFYSSQVGGSYQSAAHYAEILHEVFAPIAIVDVGCGHGTWLRAFKQRGATTLVGVDGSWITHDKLVDSDIQFVEANLNLPIQIEQKFDLAMSLEVAEHLEPHAAGVFIESLCYLSDVVLFSAAYSQQGGVNHLNEQPHSFWAELFEQQGYEVYDLFRPRVWGRPDIEFWYQQNAFLYVRKGTALSQSLQQRGIMPISNLQFLNCVHPNLFAAHCNKQTAGDFARKFLPHGLVALLAKLRG